jgi:type IV pilus assembly protein PilA
MTVARSRGFTLVEVLIVVVMASVLAAIAMPRFLQAQKRAKQSEAITNLKSLHAGMSTQLAMPESIHVPGFDPPRGNRYSYHLSNSCGTFEERWAEHAVKSEYDDCIGIDTYADPSLPVLMWLNPLSFVNWDVDGTRNGLHVNAGVFGEPDSWDYLAYAAGDADKSLYENADTWSIASADGDIVAVCPYTGGGVFVPAGEPFNVIDDKVCDY